MARTALVDTGFWIALFDPRDQYHADARNLADRLESLTLIVPWPVLYETLRTRFMRHRDWIVALDQRLKKPNTIFLDDQEYCERAFSLALDSSLYRGRPISMVDTLCRLLLQDGEFKIDYLFTTNPRDFADVCRERRINMVEL